jgi:multiple sugar transport system ATP-binding protein
MRVTLSDVRKSFGAVEVVKGLDLEIADGEFLVLLGPSGCGKTTALRMVAGLESVTAGRIAIGPRDVTEVLPKYRDIAMVFQSYALYPHMTVAANIGYPLKLRGAPRAEVEAQVRAAAAKVHLEDFLDRYPRELSGGQRQRVALARAIVRRPSVFLMDEPLSNLDAKLRTYMRAELKRLQGDLGVTTIYVTHDQIEAMTLAHRVAVMNKGVVQQIATPREIYDAPANLFVAGFIGSPPMNTLPGAIEDGAFVTAAGRVPVAGHAPRPAAVFGFRPEDARIVAPDEADLRATIYACELTGNETAVTCAVGEAQVVVKMDKSFDLAPDTPVGLAVDRAKLCLFDAATGERLVGSGR